MENDKSGAMQPWKMLYRKHDRKPHVQLIQSWIPQLLPTGWLTQIAQQPQ